MGMHFRPKYSYEGMELCPCSLCNTFNICVSLWVSKPHIVAHKTNVSPLSWMQSPEHKKNNPSVCYVIIPEQTLVKLSFVEKHNKKAGRKSERKSLYLCRVGCFLSQNICTVLTTCCSISPHFSLQIFHLTGIEECSAYNKVKLPKGM